MMVRLSKPNRRDAAMNDQTLPTQSTVNRGGSQSDLRRYNERVILSALRRHPGLFNAELSRRTGLAAQTISVILRSLEHQRLTRRGEVLRGRRGQPATPIYLNPQGAYAFGCTVGWRQLDLVLCDLEGHVVASESWHYSFPDPNEIFEQIAECATRLLRNLPGGTRSRARRLGLALPSREVWDEGIKGVPDPIVAAWQQRDLSRTLSDKLGMPVRQIAEGAAACSAENRLVMTRHCTDFGYLRLGHALSGGIVLGGRLFTGRDGKAPELGAMTVSTPQGPNRRANDVVSVAELENRLKAAGVAVPQAIGPQWDWRSAGVTLENWVADAALALAHVIHNTQSVFDCSTFVLDGTLPASLIEFIIAQTEAEIASEPAHNDRQIQLVQGQLGTPAAAIGAADIVLFETFFSLDPQA